MSLEAAQQLDAADPLASKRQLFELPAQTIYLNGNSLGPVTKAAKERLQAVVDLQWGNDLISSWNKHHWIDLPASTGHKIAPLLGAKTSEVICCDSVSINLFKLLSAALAELNQRSPQTKVTLVSQQDNFPTDLYIAEGFTELLGQERIELCVVEESELHAAIENQPAILLLTQVNFRTGAVHDIEAITRLAHQRDCLVIWDLSHSVGVMPLQLDQWQADYAVGCGYKYLNGGPGAPAFAYVNESLQSSLQQPLQGWMGHKAPFDFSPGYQADTGINRLQCGTPPILSMSALDAALDCFEGLAVHDLYAKASRLSETFMDSLRSNGAADSLQLISPRDPSERGAQLGFSHEAAYPISRALAEQGVITDFRSPDILRLGFSPLFLSYAECWQAGAILAQTVTEKLYLEQRFSVKNKVT